MSSTPIKKSVLFIISPPFIRSLAPPNLLNAPKMIVSNFCSIINYYYKNITTNNPTIKQYIEKYISLPSLTIFLNHFVTRNVTIAATIIAIM